MRPVGKQKVCIFKAPTKANNPKVTEGLNCGFTFTQKNEMLGFSLKMCHGQKSRFFGDKLIPPLMTESL